MLPLGSDGWLERELPSCWSSTLSRFDSRPFTACSSEMSVPVGGRPKPRFSDQTPPPPVCDSPVPSERVLFGTRDR